MTAKMKMALIASVALLSVKAPVLAQEVSGSIGSVNRDGGRENDHRGGGGGTPERGRPERPAPYPGNGGNRPGPERPPTYPNPGDHRPPDYGHGGDRDHDRDGDRDRDHRPPNYPPSYPPSYPPRYPPSYPPSYPPTYPQISTLYIPVHQTFYNYALVNLGQYVGLGVYAGYRVDSISVSGRNLYGGSYSTVTPIVSGYHQGTIYLSDYTDTQTLYVNSGVILNSYDSVLLQIQGNVQIDSVTLNLQR